MNDSFVSTVVRLGVLWFVATIGLSLIPYFVPEQSSMAHAIAMRLTDAGQSLGTFIAPVLQFALIVFILIAAAERMGFTREKREQGSLGALGQSNNIQAFIAIAIVGGLVIAALTGIGNVLVLKDIALVVVGFYFGTRRSQSSINEAVVAGTTAGVAAAATQAAVNPAAGDNRPEPPHERTNPVS